MPESYVHRIGRTARAGKAGVAISLCDRTERGYLRDIERLISTRIQPMDAPESTGPQEVDAGLDTRRDFDDRPPRRFESRGNDEPRRRQHGRPGGDRPQNGRPPYGRSRDDRPREDRQRDDRRQEWRRDGAPPQERNPNEHRAQDGRPPRRPPEEGSSRIGRRRHLDPRAQAPVRAEAWAEDRPQHRGPRGSDQPRGQRNRDEPRGQRAGGKVAPKPSGKVVAGEGGHAPLRRKGAAPAGKKPGGKAPHGDGAVGRIASKPFRKGAKAKAAAAKPAGKAGRRPNKQRTAS